MNKISSNLAFILLIILLIISSLKGHKEPITLAGVLGLTDSNSALSNLDSTFNQKESSGIVLRDFDSIPEQKPVNRTIDRSTAMSYIKTRSLSGTEMLELTKVRQLSEHFSNKRKVVFYVNKSSDSDIQAFMKEFANSRQKFKNNPNFVFIPREGFWDIDESSIKNSHDRVIYNLKKECGLFCIIDLKDEKLIQLKGTQVSKKGAQIIDVVLSNL